MKIIYINIYIIPKEATAYFLPPVHSSHLLQHILSVRRCGGVHVNFELGAVVEYKHVLRCHEETNRTERNRGVKTAHQSK